MPVMDSNSLAVAYEMLTNKVEHLSQTIQQLSSLTNTVDSISNVVVISANAQAENIDLLGHNVERLSSFTNAIDFIYKAVIRMEDQGKALDHWTWLIYAGLFLSLLALGVYTLFRNRLKEFAQLRFVDDALDMDGLLETYPSEEVRTLIAKHKQQLESYRKTGRFVDLLKMRKLVLKIPFSEGNAREYFLHVIGAHPFVFSILIGAPFAILTAWRYDLWVLAWFSLLGVFVTFISAYYASRSDYSATRAHKKSQQSYDQALLAYSSMKHFSDDLGEFVERAKFVLSRYEEAQKPFTIKFVSVVPAFGKIGLDKVIDGKSYYYKHMEDAHHNYEKFHDFLVGLLKRYNAGTTGDQVRGRLKMLTHKDIELSLWIKSIISASRVLNGTEYQNRLDEVVMRLKQEQDDHLTKCRNSLGTACFTIKAWPGVDDDRRIPFQFILIKPYVERIQDSHPDSKREVGGELMFLFSGDYIYSNFLNRINDSGLNKSMPLFVKFTKGYYTKEPITLAFFDKLFEYFWTRPTAEIIAGPVSCEIK